ncbi:MAG: cytochrome c3 family protein [Acidobacteriota bacterium]
MQEKQKKIIKGILVMAFAISAVLAFWVPEPGAVAKPSKTMPGKLMLDDPENKMTQFAGDFGKAPFDHDQHVKAKPVSGEGTQEKCVTCHHTNTTKLTEAVEEEVQKCGVCHKAEETTNEIEGTHEEKKFKGKTAINSEEAFHGKDSDVGCIGCHKKIGQEPTKCKECHNG